MTALGASEILQMQMLAQIKSARSRFGWTAQMVVRRFDHTPADMTRNASITAKALTISGSTVFDKTYDATNAAQITAGALNGLVNNEQLNVTGSGNFADANIGAAKSIAVSYSLADGTNGGLASPYTCRRDINRGH